MQDETKTTINTQPSPVSPTPIAEDQPQTVSKLDGPAPNNQRHFLAVFFISFMWGTLGVDRFYLGKVGTGILKLVTFGGFGLWTIIDLVLIMSGTMRDKQGHEMLQAARYKKFAAMTVLWFAIITGLVVLISGASAILAISQLVTQVQTGGIDKLLPAGLNIPGLDQLTSPQMPK